MDEKTIKKIRNKEAATGGLFLGVALYLIVLIGYITDMAMTVKYVIDIVNIFAVSSILFIFTRRYVFVCVRNNMDVGYGTAYGFILSTAIFAGIIYGSLYFIQTNYIDPDYYANLQEQLIINSTELNSTQKDTILNELGTITRNPFTVIISAIISTILMSAFLGLVVAAFAKRKPNLNITDETTKTE